MTSTQSSTPIFAATTALAGGISTCCARTTTAPLERLKILIQGQKEQYKNMGVFQGLRTIYQKEGALAFYKGNGVMMVRTFPHGALQFLSYEYYKKVLDRMSLNSAMNKFLAGSLAGTTACMFTYPLDFIRSRIAFQVCGEDMYQGIFHAFQQISRTEGGVLALYKGFMPTTMALIPGVGIAFLGFESLKDFFRKRNGIFTRIHPETKEIVITGTGSLVCGAAAGIMGQTLVYPLDVVKRRMQLAGGNPETSQKYRGVVSTFVTVYTEDGLPRGLYRGLCINYVRVVPQVAVMFSVYEVAKHFMS